MEVKSRYECISELENKKRKYIVARDNMGSELKEHEKELKYLNRQLEDKKDEIKDFKEAMKGNEKTYNELIKSVDESLSRFSKLSTK